MSNSTRVQTADAASLTFQDPPVPESAVLQPPPPLRMTDPAKPCGHLELMSRTILDADSIFTFTDETLVLLYELTAKAMRTWPNNKYNQKADTLTYRPGEMLMGYTVLDYDTPAIVELTEREHHATHYTKQCYDEVQRVTLRPDDYADEEDERCLFKEGDEYKPRGGCFMAAVEMDVLSFYLTMNLGDLDDDDAASPVYWEGLHRAVEMAMMKIASDMLEQCPDLDEPFDSNAMRNMLRFHTLPWLNVTSGMPTTLLTRYSMEATTRLVEAAKHEYSFRPIWLRVEQAMKTVNAMMFFTKPHMGDFDFRVPSLHLLSETLDRSALITLVSFNLNMLVECRRYGWTPVLLFYKGMGYIHGRAARLKILWYLTTVSHERMLLEQERMWADSGPPLWWPSLETTLQVLSVAAAAAFGYYIVK